MEARFLERTRRFGSEDYLSNLINEMAEMDIVDIEMGLQTLFADAYAEVLGAVLLTRFFTDIDD